MPQAAEAILRRVQTTNEVRAEAWDALYAARDPADLATRLRGLPLPDPVRAELWDVGVQRFTTQADDLGVLPAVRGATGISSNTRVDRAIRALPVVGGIVGGFAGGGRWNPVGVIGAGAGGAAGEAVAQIANALRGRLDLVPPTPAAQLTRIGTQGAVQGGLEGAGRGTANLAGRGARWMMNSALRPGLRVLDDAGRPITAEGTLSDRFPSVDVIGESLSRAVPIRNRGLVETQAKLGVARARAMATVKQASEARPPVRGLLPEGRTPVLLGEPPSPSGGALSVSPSHATERVPWNRQRGRQGLSDRPMVTQVFGPSPAKTARPARGDVVEGPGAILRPTGVTPSAPMIPGRGQMVGVEEALAPAKAHLASLAETALPKTKRIWEKLISDYEQAYARPVNLVLSQARKDHFAEEAERMYRTGKGPQTAKFQKLLADGYRRAVEARVPNIRALNAETQTHLALRETLLKALNRESQSGRFTIAGLLDNPRLWGAAAQGTRRVGRGAKAAPTTLRGLLLTTDPESPGEAP